MTTLDKPAITHLLQNIPEFTPTDVKVAEELIDCYMNNSVASGYHIRVAEAGDEIVGYVCYGPTPLTESTWDFYWAAVKKEKQGKGIGSQLFSFVEEKVRDAGGSQIMIDTSSTPIYEKTVRFHLRHGYKIICRIADFYAPGDDKLVLHKRLK